MSALGRQCLFREALRYRSTPIYFLEPGEIENLRLPKEVITFFEIRAVRFCSADFAPLSRKICCFPPDLKNVISFRFI